MIQVYFLRLCDENQMDEIIYSDGHGLALTHSNYLGYFCMKKYAELEDFIFVCKTDTLIN